MVGGQLQIRLADEIGRGSGGKEEGNKKEQGKDFHVAGRRIMKESEKSATEIVGLTGRVRKVYDDRDESGMPSFAHRGVDGSQFLRSRAFRNSTSRPHLAKRWSRRGPRTRTQ